MSDYLPKFRPGQKQTRTASATVIGGRIITVAGAHAAANSATWLGVASHDAVSGDDVGTYSGPGQRLTASGAIAAGALVSCDTGGKVKSGAATFDVLVGIALEAAAADGDVILFNMGR
jgi:hypothetical protein